MYSWVGLGSVLATICIAVSLTAYPVKAARSPILHSAPQGVSQWYSIFLKGNGEVVSHARILFVNNQPSPINSLELYQLAYHREALKAYQLIDSGLCVPQEPDAGPSPHDVKATDRSSQPTTCDRSGQHALEVLDHTIKAVRVGFFQKGNTLIIHLAKPILPHQRGSVIISDKTSETSSPDLFGAYHVSFASLMSSDPVERLTVGITLEDGYHFKKSASGMQYQVLGVSTMTAQNISKPVRIDSFDTRDVLTLARLAGSGEIVHTIFQMAPHTSFTLFGVYANHWAMMYGWELLTGSLVLLGFVITLVSIAHRLLHPRYVSSLRKTDRLGRREVALIILSSLGSICSICIVLGIEYGYIWQFGPMLGFNQNLTLLLLFFSLLCTGIVSLTLLFAPVLFIGARRGIWQAAATLCGSIAILAILLLCVIAYGVYPISTL